VPFALPPAGAVLDLDHPERGEQLLHEVVLLVVEGRSSEMGDDAVGDHVHGSVEVEVLPHGPVGSAVAHLVHTARAGRHLQARRTLRAESSPADGGVRVPVDVDGLLILRVDVLDASDSAVRTDRLDHPVGARRAGDEMLRAARLDRRAPPKSVRAVQLPQDRPSHARQLHLVPPCHFGPPVGLVRFLALTAERVWVSRFARTARNERTPGGAVLQLDRRDGQVLGAWQQPRSCPVRRRRHAR